VSGFRLRRTKYKTLSCGPYYSRHIEKQSFEIAYDETIIVKWSIGEVGYIALTI